MTLSPITSALSRIFTGDLSDRAQGFLITLPKGHRLSGSIDAILEDVYATAQHPDVRRITPAGKGGMITVDAIRHSSAFLASAPSGEAMKSLLILQADRMNEAATNALLKPLEEPTDHTRILLATDRPGALLPTVRSRCMTLSARYDPQDAERELTSLAESENMTLSQERLNHLLTLADGDPSLALDLEIGKLVDWIDSLPEWLAQQGGASSSPTPSLPKGIGTKSGPDLASAALGLQSVIARAARGDIALPGGDWTPDRIQRAGMSMMALMDDVYRTGLDAKTRLSILMATIASTPRTPPKDSKRT